jgi:sugar/nucleoside kinase (ribokinase family)
VYVSGYGLAAAGSGPVLGAWAAGLPGGALLFVDPGPLAAGIPGRVFGPVLARCDWLSCNQREACLLSGSNDPAGAAARLLAGDGPEGRAGPAGVVVRAGAAGCVVAHGDRITSIRTPDVTVVDTTGAGDAHSGVFLAGLAAGLTPEEAARRANVAAALAVTRPGPATAPTRAQLDAFLGPL